MFFFLLVSFTAKDLPTFFFITLVFLPGHYMTSILDTWLGFVVQALACLNISLYLDYSYVS